MRSPTEASRSQNERQAAPSSTPMAPTIARPMARSPRPADRHEWVSFEDPDEDRTWVFDVTFLLSRWTCIFGAGCQGVLTAPAEDLVQGCCSYGAHFTDDLDRKR